MRYAATSSRSEGGDDKKLDGEYGRGNTCGADEVEDDESADATIGAAVTEVGLVDLIAGVESLMSFIAS